MKEPIIILSIPKAGTHLMMKLIPLITKTPLEWIDPSLIFSENFQPQAHLKNGHIYIQHLFSPFDSLLEQKNSCTKIIMVRDLRDVFISQWNHLKSCESWTWVWDTDFIHNFTQYPLEGALPMLISEKHYGVSYFAKNALKWMEDPDVFICRFEALVGPQGGGNFLLQIQTIHALAKHLHCPISMKRAKYIAQELFGGTASFHKGQIGAWKNDFSPKNLETFNAILGPVQRALGYDD
ncbi:MAG: hypothetical protein V4492_01120 [Chlamydiota bacterium]